MFYLVQYGYTVQGFGITKLAAKKAATKNGCITPKVDDIPMITESGVNDADMCFMEAPEFDDVNNIDPTDLWLRLSDIMMEQEV